jgi:hypothetical protein
MHRECYILTYIGHNVQARSPLKSAAPTHIAGLSAFANSPTGTVGTFFNHDWRHIRSQVYFVRYLYRMRFVFVFVLDLYCICVFVFLNQCVKRSDRSCAAVSQRAIICVLAVCCCRCSRPCRMSSRNGRTWQAWHIIRRHRVSTPKMASRRLDVAIASIAAGAEAINLRNCRLDAVDAVRLAAALRLSSTVTSVNLSCKCRA